MDKLNFYRAIGLPEYQRYEECNIIFHNREWVEIGFEKEGGFRFLYIKKIVDSGGWFQGINHGADIPRDIIIKVEGMPKTEFIIDEFWIPKRYKNIVEIDFLRASIVYDPRGIITGSPLELNEELVPELMNADLEHLW